MVYLEYELNTKQVVGIYENAPDATIGYDYAFSYDFTVGEEFEKTIWINSVDENKNVTSYAAIRNNPNAQRLLSENAALKQQNEELTLATIDLADTVAAQNAQLQEQSEALLDLANTLAEVMG